MTKTKPPIERKPPEATESTQEQDENDCTQYIKGHFQAPDAKRIDVKPVGDQKFRVNIYSEVKDERSLFDRWSMIRSHYVVCIFSNDQFTLTDLTNKRSDNVSGRNIFS